MELSLKHRRAIYIDVTEDPGPAPLTLQQLEVFEQWDQVYRALVAIMYNYAPLSGHPGGSISSGRFVSGLLFDSMDYDLSDPERLDADIISYAAGHKALGLYALWAMRNEVARIARPELLPRDNEHQLRLEDLLGFRRNPKHPTPLFRDHRARALDGHPTPATPFVHLATGASGVGVCSSVGLALAASDYYGREAAPWVHIVEGEGGLTPGRVSEAMAAAATASLGNIVMHVDWNQASIDSERVCRDGERPGEYVQWTPMELAYLHDWNVIYVPDGTDFSQIISAQRRARVLSTGQPTAIVYRTTKGWRYGIEGRASHGAGHKLCSDPFREAVAPLVARVGGELPRWQSDCERCDGGQAAERLEHCYWGALHIVRRSLTEEPGVAQELAERLHAAKHRLQERGRSPRGEGPKVSRVYAAAREAAGDIPESVRLAPGTQATLRGALGGVLDHYNRVSHGALMLASADLLGSTSVQLGARGFPAGLYHTKDNPGARLISTGGICEDAMSGILGGLSSFGAHIGVGSSYGAFIAALGHVSARLHAIGAQAQPQRAARPMMLVCAHSGVMTGEDGPTHADPQPLQLLQENFPRGTCVTLTPWDPQELWPLVSAALVARPAVIAPFVTRPNVPVLDRAALGLASARASASGVYHLRAARGTSQGTLVLQGSGVTYAFVQVTLPKLLAAGIELDVYYVASVELFDRLSMQEQTEIFPETRSQAAIGITGFTLPTMYRWVRSDWGRARTLHPFKNGHFLGSGQAQAVLSEAGLDGESQFAAISRWVHEGWGQPRPSSPRPHRGGHQVESRF